MELIVPAVVSIVKFGFVTWAVVRVFESIANGLRYAAVYKHSD